MAGQVPVCQHIPSDIQTNLRVPSVRRQMEGPIMNMRAILRCLRAAKKGLTKGVLVSTRSFWKNHEFVGCAIGQLAHCKTGGSQCAASLRNKGTTEVGRAVASKYDVPEWVMDRVVDANDGFYGTNLGRQQYIILWFKEVNKLLKTWVGIDDVPGQNKWENGVHEARRACTNEAIRRAGIQLKKAA